MPLRGPPDSGASSIWRANSSAPQFPTLVAPRPRASCRGQASAKRARLAEERVAPILAGEEPSTGVLRRRTVGERTRVLYQKSALDFLRQTKLGAEPPPSAVDKALERELDRFFLTGEGTAPGRTLFYALRWWLCLRNEQLPLSSEARRGHGRVQRPVLQEPETWEHTLLTALALMQEPQSKTPIATRAVVASGLLLSFDLYGRAHDLIKALKSELRGPLPHQRSGPASRWTLTLYPITADLMSKTRTQDETLIIGSSNPRRAWLQCLGPALKQFQPSDPRLLPVDPKEYQNLFTQGRQLAKLGPSNLHRLRHGGASADALQTGIDSISDRELAHRGRWKSMNSIRRYRQPARYLRQLQALSSAQLLKVELAETVMSRLLTQALK